MTTIDTRAALTVAYKETVVHIDPILVATALQQYVKNGSKITGVDVKEINLNITDKIADIGSVTLPILLENGMKLFDAIVWLSAERSIRPDLVVDPSMKSAGVPSMNEIAKALFYVYFFILTQARYPGVGTGEQLIKVPKFLTSVMGLDKGQEYYKSIVCSFNIAQFDPAWVRNIRFQGLGQEFLSRAGLGVAGYRLFGPFKLYSLKEGVSADVQRAYQVAQAFAKAPATWLVHPVTRSPDLLTSMGNLNKNLGNLILECFTDEEIVEMEKNRIIFARPEKDPAHRNWKQWTLESFDFSGDLIFSA